MRRPKGVEYLDVVGKYDKESWRTGENIFRVHGKQQVLERWVLAGGLTDNHRPQLIEKGPFN